MHGMTDTFGALVPLLFQEGHGHGGMGDLWELWLLFPLVFFGGLVALIALVVARIFPRVREDERLGAPRDSAEEILRERFARGEITAEEYERSLEVLRTGTARKARQDDARESDERGG